MVTADLPRHGPERHEFPVNALYCERTGAQERTELRIRTSLRSLPEGGEVKAIYAQKSEHASYALIFKLPDGG